jgi:hypothetical protein
MGVKFLAESLALLRIIHIGEFCTRKGISSNRQRWPRLKQKVQGIPRPALIASSGPAQNMSIESYLSTKTS